MLEAAGVAQVSGRRLPDEIDLIVAALRRSCGASAFDCDDGRHGTCGAGCYAGGDAAWFVTG